MTHEQRIQNELIFQAKEAAKERAAMQRTPAELVERYIRAKRWRTHRVECLIKWLTMHQPAHICDFGCGSGEMACRLGLMGFRVTGIDVSPELIAVARERAMLDGVADRVTFEVADGATADLGKGKFDAVLAMSVLHHLPLEEGLRTLKGMLKPGGRIAFQEPVAYSKLLQWVRDRSGVPKDVSPDERQLSRAEIIRIGEVFQIEEMRHFALLHRLWRIVPRPFQRLTDVVTRWLDRALLLLPGMDQFAGCVVLLVRKRSDD